MLQWEGIVHILGLQQTIILNYPVYFSVCWLTNQATVHLYRFNYITDRLIHDKESFLVKKCICKVTINHSCQTN